MSMNRISRSQEGMEWKTHMLRKRNDTRSKQSKQTLEGSLGRTNAPTGRVDRNWAKSGGKAPWPGFLWVSSRKSHTTRRRGHLRVAISTVPDPSGSGRVDMLTSPVAAARAVVATGAWVKSKHDMYLIRGSLGA